MSILSRYIVGELLRVFLVALAAMTAMMLLVGIFQEAIREGLTPATMLKLVPYVLPNALCFAIPGTMLFSVCVVFGRMSAANEIVAIKSLGISPMVAVWPAIVLAVLLSLVTVFLNDLAVSWGRQGVYRVILHSVEKTIYAVLNSERNYHKGRLSIVVQDVDDRYLIGPIVQYYQADNSQARFSAERARLSVNPETDTLVFSVEHAQLDVLDRELSVTLPEGVVEIPLRDTTRRRQEDENPSIMPLRVMPLRTAQQQQEIADAERQLSLRATVELVGGDWVAVANPQWNNDLALLQESRLRLHRLQTEPWRRWANGFSCLSFVLVGVPLAIYLRKSDFWTTFALVFIPILLAYYPLLMLGLSSAKSGAISPPSVWLGNLVLGILGVLLVRRIMRH